MKKYFLSLFVMAMAVLLLAGCGTKYKVDGDFTAFEVTEYEEYDKSVIAQVTWVTVTIKDGKVTKYFLDERQSKIVEGDLVWNAKTKKELKGDYGMEGASPIGKEWHEQAKAIEDKWLADGVNSIEVDDDKYITNMETSATMVDSNYSKLAAKALDYAKKGVSVAFEVTEHEEYDKSLVAQVTWVEATIKGGKVVSYFLDERQSKVTDNKLSWNAKTKKELKGDYGMEGASPIGKEWHEQAEAIEAKWLADGVNSIEVDDDKYITNMETTATMVDSNYSKLAKKALAVVGL